MKHSCEFGVGVLKSYRGLGIGTRLIRRLEQWAFSKELRRISLSILENNVDGIKLYKRLGFEVEGNHKSAVLVNNRFIDLIDMAKLLPCE